MKKLVNGVAVDMTADEEAAFLASLPAPPKVNEVTMRQARLALRAAGLLASVEAAIASMDEPDKTAAAIEWEFSSTVRRDNATFTALTTALGLTSQQVDDLFNAAAAIP